MKINKRIKILINVDKLDHIETASIFNEIAKTIELDHIETARIFNKIAKTIEDGFMPLKYILNKDGITIGTFEYLNNEVK